MRRKITRQNTFRKTLLLFLGLYKMFIFNFLLTLNYIQKEYERLERPPSRQCQTAKENKKKTTEKWLGIFTEMYVYHHL